MFADGIFALKGGTAINLFLRDMPRLSVDLDLVFVDHRPSREEALASINAAIRKAVSRLEANGFPTHVPDWSLLEIAHLDQLPAIRWKLQNLQQLARENPTKLRTQADDLTRLLEPP